MFYKYFNTIFKGILRFIPSFASFGLVTKISMTVLICGLCADLFYAKLNSALPLLKGALSFSPVQYTQKLIEQDKLKTAEEYIVFYKSIPGVPDNPQLDELYQKIYNERHGIVSGTFHQAKHAWKGVKKEESDELIAQATDVAADFTSVGDVRDLWTEYKNYSEGKDVDMLSAGLAGIGLVMTLGELAGTIGGVVSGGTSTASAIAIFEPIKKMSLGLKKALKLMNPKLRKACQKFFEPVFKNISNSKLFHNIPKLTNLSELKAFAQKNIGKIEEIAKNAKNRLANLGDFTEVLHKNPFAARQISENAGNIKSVASLSKMALDLGAQGKEIFRFGGKRALEAMETLGKKGRLSAKTLKESMRFGPDGLKAVAKGCWKSLSKMLGLVQKYSSLIWMFMLQYFISKIPFFLALLIELGLILVLLKTWIVWPWNTHKV